MVNFAATKYSGWYLMKKIVQIVEIAELGSTIA